MTGGLLSWNRSRDFLLILNSEASLHTGIYADRQSRNALTARTIAFNADDFA